MRKIIFICLVFSVFVSACKEKETKETANDVKMTKTERLMNATLWYQRSAEMRALYYQCYNHAKLALDNNLAALKPGKKAAVVLDIDETVLDNSPFEAKCIERGEGYSSKAWKEWTDRAEAKALPGALEFLNYAKSKNVEIFYISNRKTDELKSTMKNMLAEKFPSVDTARIFMKTTTSCKDKRRAVVSKDYEIILFIGDNLTDYASSYGERGSDFGFNLVDKNKADFGNKFIMLPNPMYGEWETAVYKNDYTQTKAKKDSLRRAALISY